MFYGQSTISSQQFTSRTSVWALQPIILLRRQVHAAAHSSLRNSSSICTESVLWLLSLVKSSWTSEVKSTNYTSVQRTIPYPTFNRLWAQVHTALPTFFAELNFVSSSIVHSCCLFSPCQHLRHLGDLIGQNLKHQKFHLSKSQVLALKARNT